MILDFTEFYFQFQVFSDLWCMFLIFFGYLIIIFQEFMNDYNLCYSVYFSDWILMVIGFVFDVVLIFFLISWFGISSCGC